MRVYLAVPYKEKEEAKSLGARWDFKNKMWYAPNGESNLIEKWKLNEEPVTELKGEDRNFGGNVLFVDLIPNSCWFTNVRTSVHSKDWDRLRKYVYTRANNECECCKSAEYLEAHERWHYDYDKMIQKLMRIIALCKKCHEATHMGLAGINGRNEIATEHLKLVTGMNQEQVIKHIEDAFSIWSERNKFEWDLDIDLIVNSGITIVEKYNMLQRKALALKKTNAPIKSPIRTNILYQHLWDK